MKILLIEDDHSLRNVIKAILEDAEYLVDAFPSGEEALEHFEAGAYACVVSDFRLPKMDGVTLLEKIRERDSRVPSLIMTAYGTIEIAVQAIKRGATDFLVKPFESNHFLGAVQQVIEHRRIFERTLGLSTRKDRRLTSASPRVHKVMGQAQRVAKVDSSVFIFGESGTGKELLARYIHEHSPRSGQPFVAINCAALPPELLESEFFGHEPGAFTGATRGRIGLFEYAADGTIFLDEIGDMPKTLQVKLLRALQEKEIKRVGGNKAIHAAPRIIAATNYSEHDVLELGKVREDLYYRLAVMTFCLPPLREREEDIHFLSAQFAEFFSGKMDKAIPALSSEALDVLLHYSWPGNARELENVIERAVLLSSESILPEHLGIKADCIPESQEDINLHLIAEIAVRSAEIEAISKVLSKTLWNKSKAAQLLGVSYKTLLHKVKEYGLEPAQQ